MVSAVRDEDPVLPVDPDLVGQGQYVVTPFVQKAAVPVVDHHGGTGLPVDDVDPVPRIHGHGRGDAQRALGSPSGHLLVTVISRSPNHGLILRRDGFRTLTATRQGATASLSILANPVGTKTLSRDFEQYILCPYFSVFVDTLYTQLNDNTQLNDRSLYMGVLDSFSLTGRTAVVTGGSGPQFGSSISEALAEAGATVVVASRNLENNQRFVASLNERGFDTHPEELDITETDSIDALKQRVMDRFGRVDVLVNSAVVGRGGGFDEQTPDYWAASAQGNMVGLFALCKAFVPVMADQGGGSIINISSIYGVVANDPGLYEETDMKQPPDYTFVKG
ncbi:MAG: SDR family NAD(P)-dependent oxidoreductase, partial [Gemmatimonadetes bacterium]|nr:SDR family NAD(P)-dependent oxidoreductase [Gemmatimonadota bacterium]